MLMEGLRSEDRTGTLDPLPDTLYRGLLAVVFCGFLSLLASSCLFILLTYRMLRWYTEGTLQNGVNQYFFLIYNLLLADIQQAMAFSLTVVYIFEGKIEIGTSVCWTNGWFVSVGDLASGVFIFNIALHTFFTVTMNRRPSDNIFWFWMVGAWTFVYIMACIGIAIDPKLYVRAGAWCWIDRKYNIGRLWLHYFWIFVFMFAMVILYVLIFASIRAKSRIHGSIESDNISTPKRRHRIARYMFIFPAIYVFCTLPLAGGRMAAMTGIHIPYWYYCFAGAAITSCGWLDVILYALSRRIIVFSKEPPPTTTFGLETFGWSLAGQWDTITTIEGPSARSKKKRHGRRFAARISSVCARNSDEEYFATPSEGVITTKTTVEVHAEQIGLDAVSKTQGIEMEDSSMHASSSST